MTAAIPLPEPSRRENECGVDGAYWDLQRATGYRVDWIQSYVIDGVPVVYDGPGPEGMYSVEEMRERCLAGLAACADAERMVAEQRAAELNEMARGNAATHTWGTKDGLPTGTIECTTCRTLVYHDDLLRAGAVPVCGDRCPLSWHAVSSVFRTPAEVIAERPIGGRCFHCHAVYQPTEESASGVREGAPS